MFLTRIRTDDRHERPHAAPRRLEDALPCKLARRPSDRLWRDARSAASRPDRLGVASQRATRAHRCTSHSATIERRAGISKWIVVFSQPRVRFHSAGSYFEPWWAALVDPRAERRLQTQRHKGFKSIQNPYAIASAIAVRHGDRPASPTMVQSNFRRNGTEREVVKKQRSVWKCLPDVL